MIYFVRGGSLDRIVGLIYIIFFVCQGLRGGGRVNV